MTDPTLTDHKESTCLRGPDGWLTMACVCGWTARSPGRSWARYLLRNHVASISEVSCG